MQIQILDNRLTALMLQPTHKGDAGIDMRACIDKEVNIPRGHTVSVPAGIKTAIPDGFVGLLIPKSGKGSKGLNLANVIGVIDSGYRGEVIMKIKNNANNVSPMIVKPMDKVVQMVVVPHYDYSQLQFTINLNDTTRGEDGFGSTD